MVSLSRIILVALLSNDLALHAQETRRVAGPIHSVTDISHEFTFYFDGRFARDYLPENGADTVGRVRC
jgi:hypothetical protein